MSCGVDARLLGDGLFCVSPPGVAYRLGVEDACVSEAVAGFPGAACREFDAAALVAEALIEGERSFVFCHDPQIGVFVRVDDGFVECLSEAGAVRVVEGVQVREFAGACGQFGEVICAFKFPSGLFA